MKNDSKSSIGGDAIILTSSKLITMGISLISAMLLSRFRTLEQYGTYSQLLTVINIFTSLLMLGLPNSINYFVALVETDDERQKFLSVYYTLSTILSIIVGLTLVLSTSLIVDYFDNNLIRGFVYFLAIYPWATIMASSIENVLIVYQKIYLLIIYRILNSVLLLSNVILVQFFELGFDTYMLIFVIIQSIFAIVVYIIVHGISGRLVMSLDKTLIKKIFMFSIPIGMASVVGTLNLELDKLMIGNFLGTEQLAIYANASKEMPVIIISSSFTSVLMPQLVRFLRKGKNKEAVDLWGNATVLSYIFISFFAASFFVFAPDVMTVMYSEKYLAGVSVFRIFNIILLLRCTYFGIILNSKGKTKFILYSSIATLILNATLNYLFFRLFGFEGPALATLLATLVIAIFQLIATSKVIEMPFKDVLPWKNIFSITVMNIIFGALFFLIKNIIPLNKYIGEISESIILGVLWGLLYFILSLTTIKNKWSELKGEAT